MIREIPNQETNRREKRDDHAHHVAPPGAVPDEIPPGRNENGAHEIKRGIEGRQVGG